MKMIAAAALLTACGGSNPTSTLDAPTVADSSIAGTTPFTARLFNFDPTTPTTAMPVANAFARIEGATGATETQADADGSVMFMIDPTAGPFTITIAKAGVGAATIVDAAESVGDIYLNAKVDVAGSVSGAITGQAAPGDQVVVGSYAARGSFAFSGSYTEPTYSAIAQDMVAFELGAGDTLINIATSTTTVDAGGSQHADIAFPAAPPSVTTIHTTVHFPRTGAAPALGVPTDSLRFGNPCALAALQADPQALFKQLRLRSVGCGTSTTADAAGTATVTLQFAGGDLAPASGWGIYNSSDGSPVHAVVSMPPIDGTEVTLPPADTLALSGVGADTLQWSAGGEGYTEAVMTLEDPGHVAWYLSAPPSTALRALPTLPGGLHLSDLTSASTVTVRLDLLIYPDGATNYQPTGNYLDLLGVATNLDIATTGR